MIVLMPWLISRRRPPLWGATQAAAMTPTRYAGFLRSLLCALSARAARPSLER